MKTNKYADLVKFGLSPKTLMTLSESDVNRLHSNLVEGKKKVCPKCGMKNCKCQHSKKKETKEITSKTSTTATADLNSPTDVQAVNKILVDKGINAEINPSTKKMNITSGEVKEGKKKKKDDYSKVNPWAICHSQVGPKKSRKFERCVRQVKKMIGENKNPFDVILENKILSLVEKHLNPKMTKGELMNLLGKKIVSEGGTKEKEAPVKDPGTKTPPKPKTKDPFKPEPHKQPKPKAHHHKKHETKEAVMDAPVKTPPVKDPGTKTPPKPKTKDPFRPEPHKPPTPTARIPKWLRFNNLGIKFKK